MFNVALGSSVGTMPPRRALAVTQLELHRSASVYGVSTIISGVIMELGGPAASERLSHPSRLVRASRVSRLLGHADTAWRVPSR